MILSFRAIIFKILALNLLAFFIHQVFELCEHSYQLPGRSSPRARNTGTNYAEPLELFCFRIFTICWIIFSTFLSNPAFELHMQ